jgi:hypothetical protein
MRPGNTGIGQISTEDALVKGYFENCGVIFTIQPPSKALELTMADIELGGAILSKSPRRLR